MPANKSSVAAKTALLAPVAPIESWAVQQLLSGDVATGVAGMITGAVFVAAFVVVNEYDIPYEDEILSAVAASDPEETADTATDVAEAVGGEVSESDVGSNGGDS